MEDGANENECAQALGMRMHRFKDWREQDRAREALATTAELVPVEVTGAPFRHHSQLVLITPSGYRVEGLTVADALAMLEVLR